MIILLLCLLLLPIPYGYAGMYNTWSGLIYCQPEACAHEVGHKLDDMSGWVSRTDEFQYAISDMAEMGLALQDNSQEDYAWIFELAHGQRENMPEQLQEFYDWELAEQLLEKYKEKTW